ncbi:ATP-binding cassette domain-containing protein [Leucobacter sp. CSA2]|uniref:ATP-binding cassette domain-containing protein n=1 Tax=Leucobacter edaphi TaxID=2796472 RepID=A0A934QF48_9MICO|nr:ATP-binding cassette domain-containing protein [Leucobacter edaphi]
MAGGALALVLIAVAVLAPVLAPYAPGDQDLANGLAAPGGAHPLGTDQLGRDVLSRMLYAARTDLGLAVLAAIAPFVIGVTVGLVSGYFGRAVDWVASRLTDTVIAFPFYVIVIAIVFAVGAGPGGIILAFALVGWVGYARVIRSMSAALRESGWVLAARGGGLSHARVLLRHVLPNVLPQAIVLFATEIVLIMVAIVTLGYLGLGIRPPTPDWGTMIADAQPFLTTQWWLAAFPGLAVVLTGVTCSLLGDGIADALRARPAMPRRNASRVVPETRSRRTPRGRAGAGAATPAGGGTPGAVRVDGLRIAASDGRPLVDGVTFQVEPGGSLGIVGESGSGKSLTLRAILGQLPEGTRVTGGTVAVGGSVGMVFQDPLTALDPLTRVGSQLRDAVEAAIPLGVPAPDPAARARELMELVRLPEPARLARRYPHQLSGGQRQRLVIAMALAAEPDVLLCDEPTTALDVTVQREILDLLAELRRSRGMTLLFVSHDLAVTAAVCERILVLRGGREVEAGPTARIVGEPGAGYTAELVAAVPRLPGSVPIDGASSLAAPAAAPTGPAEPSVEPAAPAAPAAPTAPAAAPRLEVRGLEVRYGRGLALWGADFALAAGEAIGVVGESGSGKTTLARAIVGQLRPAQGEILLDGRPLSAHRTREERLAIQLVPQDPASSLDPRMTVGGTLGELLRANRIVERSAVPDRVAELLRLVRLDPAIAGSRPHELSGGQRQRVAIARAIAVEPEVLVADEPTSALDVSVQASIIELLGDLRRDLGLSLVFVSHDLAVVHALCDEVLVMHEGRIVEHSGRDFFAGPQTPYARELLAAVPRLPGTR